MSSRICLGILFLHFSRLPLPRPVLAFLWCPSLKHTHRRTLYIWNELICVYRHFSPFHLFPPSIYFLTALLARPSSLRNKSFSPVEEARSTPTRSLWPRNTSCFLLHMDSALTELLRSCGVRLHLIGSLLPSFSLTRIAKMAVHVLIWALHAFQWGPLWLGTDDFHFFPPHSCIGDMPFQNKSTL